MKLTVGERLVLLGVLPSEGDLLTMKVVVDLQNDAGFSKEELAALNIHADEAQGMTVWNEDADPNKDVSLGPKATSIVVGVLEKLSSDKKITADHLPLCKKFLGEAL